MKAERSARWLVLILTLGASLVALAFRFWSSPRVIEVHAAMPDRGGWLTADLYAQAGDPLHLRLVSDDVVHSFALGKSDFEPVDLLPGKPVDVTLFFDAPGTYTFYCTRWCGADHWRMRGTITVQGDQPIEIVPPVPPLYLQLGIDLDAPHDLHNLDLAMTPSAVRGADLGITLPAERLTLEYYRAHTPSEAWEDLRAEPVTANLSDAQVWDLVAWVWEQSTDPATLAEGEAIYQRDCAACHGKDGSGDGVFASEAITLNGNPHLIEPDGHSLETPTNFRESSHMLSASPALLQGKIIRGGMGTGMPSWGLIYTEDQTWSLVDYLWTFVFDYLLDE